MAVLDRRDDSSHEKWANGVRSIPQKSSFGVNEATVVWVTIMKMERRARLLAETCEAGQAIS